jgi:chromosome segregation ATPase
MKHFRNTILPLVLALALVVIGCGTPPEAEKAAAKTAMDQAIAANAGKYAAADFDAAMKIWTASEAQMNDKKYEEAQKGYIAAKAAFEKATAAAAAGKKTMTDEANAAVASLEEGWKNLEADAKKLEKKLKEQKEAWEADAKSFADSLKAAKDSIPTDPGGVKKKAAELKATIDKWEASFKELASAPAKKGKK